MPHLFTYGSLMCPEIMARVAGVQAASTPATLHHFRRSRLQDLDYPGIFPDDVSRLSGILYLHLGEEAIRRLDDFEGEQYQRLTVEVELEDGRLHPAMAYVLKERYRPLATGEEWDFATFLAEGKQHFLATYCGFATLCG